MYGTDQEITWTLLIHNCMYLNMHMKQIMIYPFFFLSAFLDHHIHTVSEMNTKNNHKL